MLNEDELRDAVLLVFANKQVSHKMEFILVCNIHQQYMKHFVLFAGPSECDECCRSHRQVGASSIAKKKLVHPGNMCHVWKWPL